MPATDHEKRQQFATAYVLSGNGTQAAIAAGVPAGSAATMASKWLRNPAVAVMVRQAMDLQLRHLAPVALNVIREMIEDPETPPAIRLTACRDVLDRAAFTPPKRVEARVEVETAAIEHLSRAQLEELVAREAAQVINGECHDVETEDHESSSTNSGPEQD
jgi:phage terminase small subunit